MDNTEKQNDNHMALAFEKYARSVIRRAAIDYERTKKKNSNAIPFSCLWEGQVDTQLQVSDTYLHESRFEFMVNGETVRITDERVADALTTLTEKEREIILMYYVFSQKDRAISEATGLNRRTVNATRLNAVEKLRKCLHKDT